MGAGPFLKFVRTFCPHAIRSAKISQLPGKEVVVDATGLADKFLAAARLLALRQGAFRRQPHTKQGLRCLFLRPLLALAIEIAQGGGAAVFVVDTREGSPPPLMPSKATKKRGAAKSEEMKFTARFLTLCGLQVVSCRGNGDKVMAYLSRKSSAIVVSEDADVVPLGAFGLATQVRLTKPLTVVAAPAILQALRLSPQRFALLYSLLGLSGTARLPRVAASILARLLREGASLEDILAKYNAEAGVKDQVLAAHNHLKVRRKPSFQHHPVSSFERSTAAAMLKEEFRPGRLKTALEKKIDRLSQIAECEAPSAPKEVCSST